MAWTSVNRHATEQQLRRLDHLVRAAGFPTVADAVDPRTSYRTAKKMPMSVDKEEQARIEAAAESVGLTSAALVRMAVRAFLPRVLDANALYKDVPKTESWEAALERGATERILSGGGR